MIAERPGAGRTEDRVVVLPNAVALLDGATTLLPTAHDGGWYAERLGEALRTRLADGTGTDLADVLAAAIEDVVTTHDLRPGESPSSTVALVRWDDEVVEGLVLADSPVVAFTDADVHVVADHRLAQVPRTVAYGPRLRAGGGFDDEHWATLVASARGVREWRNREGGFWVAEAVPAAAHQAVRASWPRADVRAVVMASDGVSCGVEDYGVFPDWSALLACAERHGPDAVLDRVRAAEESDPDGRRWPRSKRHDDQSLAVIRFDGAAPPR
ncbi:Protein phosphatase 2C [Streptoalloteichus tenebrarius]|uniref:Protein phosphatase 2C n=2 Tax=Streptoalloteichus tenebrarius (strain ATCC 17920 / DSM 40477 / JCM 4838 / CBS 697.72 / NBRC 16177 / NCIMB 11028 / NRRL B-12390 / A12253. 1 / ISP 5477) TaxID=1933 RepID=A0ABT1HV71_STRSD|nr:Protein phosphatase 2C [Streptoalloteichus tenebrarius]BFF02367.1 protein phosphatase 2C domain-containing protein [Streptoalloteichus tenebrarius]